MRPNQLGAGLRAMILLSAIGGLGAGLTQSAPAQKRTAPKPTSSRLDQGRRVFIQDCASCHGERGNGKPASGLALKPPALDLTAHKLSQSLILRALHEGVPGTGMAAWNSLSAEQMSAVSAYTASLGRRDQLSRQARVAPDNLLREAGRRVFVVHCARCHGGTGAGDGPEASLYKPPPASFSEMQPSYAASARAIEAGIPGSAMPAWPLLTRAEVQAVTFYIRSLYRGSEGAGAPRPPSGKHGAEAQP
jgi:mono/diheme cytochrome c family protein